MCAAVFGGQKRPLSLKVIRFIEPDPIIGLLYFLILNNAEVTKL